MLSMQDPRARKTLYSSCEPSARRAAVVQPFDVARQRADGLDLRDDALLRDSKQDAGRGEFGPRGAAGHPRRTARAVALRAPATERNERDGEERSHPQPRAARSRARAWRGWRAPDLLRSEHRGTLITSRRFASADIYAASRGARILTPSRARAYARAGNGRSPGNQAAGS